MNEVPCSVSVIIIVVNLLNKEDDGEDWWDRACRFLSLRFRPCSCSLLHVLTGACVCVPPKRAHALVHTYEIYHYRPDSFRYDHVWLPPLTSFNCVKLHLTMVVNNAVVSS